MGEGMNRKYGFYGLGRSVGWVGAIKMVMV